MPGGNPSADPVASTDRRGMLRHSPFSCLPAESPIGRGTKAQNPGGAGAKPPQAAPAPTLLLRCGRPLIMHTFCGGKVSENLDASLFRAFYR